MNQASDSTLKSVISLVRNSSVSRLKTLSGREDVSISEVSKAPLVFAHWMTFIIVSGPALRIIFKTHFATLTGQYFAAKIYGLAKERVSQSRSLDFFKEYCNLTAGQIKKNLDQNNIKVGASLPGLMRGFDEIFDVQKSSSKRTFWSLNCGGENFFCSTNIEIFDQFHLRVTEGSETLKEGNVEFL